MYQEMIQTGGKLQKSCVSTMTEKAKCLILKGKCSELTLSKNRGGSLLAKRDLCFEEKKQNSEFAFCSFDLSCLLQ
jgi:hypothetical protein